MEYILNLDGSILLFIQENLRVEALNGFWKFISFLGDGGWFWIALAVGLLIPKKTRKIGFTALLSLAFCALITNVCLKNLVARTRPYDAIEAIVPLVARPTDFSFPSGHTCASFASALIYLRMAPKKYGVASVILATLIAFSRLYVGVHYPLDVLGGFVVALFGSFVVYWFMNKYENKKAEDVR